MESANDNREGTARVRWIMIMMKQILVSAGFILGMLLWGYGESKGVEVRRVAYGHTYALVGGEIVRIERGNVSGMVLVEKGDSPKDFIIDEVRDYLYWVRGNWSIERIKLRANDGQVDERFAMEPAFYNRARVQPWGLRFDGRREHLIFENAYSDRGEQIKVPLR